MMRLLPLCLGIALLLAACGQHTAEIAVPQQTGLPEIASLDSLRHASDLTPQVSGADAIATSGPPSAQPHPTQSTWLVLDGTQATGGFAWAVWRIQLGAQQAPDYVNINLPQSYPNRYWIAFADFAAERWQFLDTAGNQLGVQGATAHVAPPDPGVMLSPSAALYVAVLVMPTQTINVAYSEASYTSTSGGNDPIFDDFENNDTLDTSYALPGAGTYHASIHQSYRTDMSNPAEFRDRLDIYTIDIPPGKELTVTLRHEAHDHFNPAPPPPDYTDLDLMFYDMSAISAYNDFIEADSSFNVFYGFEQIHLIGLSGQYKLGILGAIDDQYDDNAEYDLGVFYSSATHSVSGKITQAGFTVDKRFTAFLEPGNFNVVTNFDSGHEGEFTIEGVPDGVYNLKVQGSAGFYQTGYVYPNTRQVTVSGANVSAQNLNIDAFPPQP